MPANRPATDRTQSLRPLFSWMTSTPPRAFGASAHAACSSPCGPGPGDRLWWAALFVRSAAAAALDGGGAAGGHRGFGGGLLVLAARGDQRGGRGGAHAQQREPAQGFASGQQPST